MTMLDERTEAVTFDLDDEPECSDSGWIDEPDTDCPNPARWQYRGTCGRPWNVCNEHHDEMTDPTSNVAGARCTCGNRTPNTKLTWRHL